MTVPRYRTYTGDLVTGGPLVEVDLIDMSFTCPLTGAGSVGGSFPMRSGEWPDAVEEAMVGKRLLLVTYDDGAGHETAIEGGPIWVSNYSTSDGMLKIGALGLWSYFDHVKALPALTNLVEKLYLNLGGSLAQIAHDLVQQVLAALPASVPLDLPDRATLGGGDHQRNYPGYELAWLGERIKQLTEVESGPEVQFAPRLIERDGQKFADWSMRIGTEATGHMVVQDGPDHVLDTRTVESPVRKIDVATDGSRLADRVFAAGQGQGEGRPIEYVQSDYLRSRGWPHLDAEVTSTDSVTERSTLIGHAVERQAIGTLPMRTITVEYERDAPTGVGAFRPGDWVTLTIEDDPYLCPGREWESRQRVVQISGGNGSDQGFVGLAMQEGAL